MVKIKHIINDKHLCFDTKLRAFNAYVSSVLLHNSETWTLTKTDLHKVDVPQAPEHVIYIHTYYPNIISNKHVYEKAKPGELRSKHGASASSGTSYGCPR